MRALLAGLFLVVLAPARAQQPPREPLRDAMTWLLKHQDGAGAWGATVYKAKCGAKKCEPSLGHDIFDVGLTALACLAFSSGGTHMQDPRENGRALRKGIEWLVKQQDADGCVGSKSVKHMYNQAIATMAMAEALRAIPADSKQPEDDLRRALSKAVTYLVEARNPKLAWRYTKRCGDSDVSVTAWVIQALVAARRANERVPDEAFREPLAWMNTLVDGRKKVGYTKLGEIKVSVPGNEHFADHPMHGAALGYARQLTASAGASEFLKEVAADLPKAKPDTEIDVCYWYFGTRYLRELGGEGYVAFKSAVTRAMTDTQCVGAADDCKRGSWEPSERWSGEGGRVYVTAMNAYTLTLFTAQKTDTAAQIKWIIVLKSGGRLKACECSEKDENYVLTMPGGGSATVK